MSNGKERLEQNVTKVAETRKISCSIKGTAPLLMSVFNPNLERQRDITPEQDCNERLYLYNGEIVQPAIHLEKAMEKMAGEVKIPGAGKKSYRDLVKAFVSVEPVFIEHKIPKWVVYSVPVVIKATKGRIMRHRPMFPKWELSFEIVVRNTKIELSKLEDILRRAGEFNGLGDYRPKFGRFEVTKFEIQN